MGTHNRDRRRQKKRREEAAARARERRRAWAGGLPGSDLDGSDIERVLVSAVIASRLSRGADFDDVQLLAEGPPGAGGRGLVDAVVARYLRGQLAAAAERGWTPADLERVVRKRLSKAHVRAIEAADEAPGGAFIDYVAAKGWGDRYGAVERVLDVLALLSELPRLPKLRSAERTRHGVDGRILKRVRALLAKAESTTFPDEAEALSAKAQELMTRHAVDRALVDDAADPTRHGHGASSRRLGIDDPYARPKSLLLTVIARANRCEAVWSVGLGFSTVFGADDDLDIVELLFTSLLCQAAAAMTAASSAADSWDARRSRTRSFRRSFFIGYATRIGHRLREATETAVDDASEAYGAERLLPVLAARSEAAEAAADEAFPHAKRSGFAAHDGAGWAAGTAAADVASLHLHREVGDAAG